MTFSSCVQHWLMISYLISWYAAATCHNLFLLLSLWAATKTSNMFKQWGSRWKGRMDSMYQEHFDLCMLCEEQQILNVISTVIFTTQFNAYEASKPIASSVGYQTVSQRQQRQNICEALIILSDLWSIPFRNWFFLIMPVGEFLWKKLLICSIKGPLCKS